MATLKRPAPDAQRDGNISSKTFVRTTRSGKVQKIVREVYLRQDIPCSSQLCRSCLETAPRDAGGHVAPFVLGETPLVTPSYPRGHYLVPDTNAFLTGMDLFEHTAAFYDVVVLQVVLEEVRNRSLPLYNRLVGLTRSEDKRFYVFFNEFRLETHVARAAGESINDRNDRAVRRATEWYAAHLAAAAGPKAPAVVMISNDRDNVAQARAAGLAACTLGDYVRQLGGDAGDALLDMLPEAQDESVAAQMDEKARRPAGAGAAATQQQQQQHLYPAYRSLSRLMTGVQAGLLHQGTFSVSPYNYLEGAVRVSRFPQPLLILGREAINRAVDGDVVVVEVLPRAQWKAPSTQLLDEALLTKDESAGGGEEDEEEATAAAAAAGGRGGMHRAAAAREQKALQEAARQTQRLKRQGQGQGEDGGGVGEPTARVVGVVRRNWRQFVGHVDRTSLPLDAAAAAAQGGQGRTPTSVFVVPMDKRLPKMRLRTRQAGALAGQRILVALDAWERDARHPVGHLVRALGPLESQAAETEALLLEFDVQYRPFPRTVLDCLPAAGHGWRVPAQAADGEGLWRGREDLRDLLVCSIDPEGCQDIDDALHARPHASGTGWEVGVHIADVSHFVRAGTAMDAEAAVRGTTVYLVDKRIDMLPMLLGTDLCSLRPDVERFAFSVVWHLTDAAEVVDVRFCKSVIRSRAGLSYAQAQLRIDDAAQQDPLTAGMRVLLRLSRLLRQRRLDAGALSLSSPEVKVHLASETADPLDAGDVEAAREAAGGEGGDGQAAPHIETKALLATNSLVEEFMLLANTTVAARIVEAFPQTALLRRHAAPPTTNFAELARQLHVTRGFTLAYESSRALADSLDTCVDPAVPYFNTLVRILATRCMTAAEYFPAGALAPAEFRHYGLAAPLYTHFTSPIRRYADLVVHRQLAAAIGYEGVDEPTAGAGRATTTATQLATRGRLAAVCRNINARHRNAQLAGRASIAYYVGQAVRGRQTVAAGFVLRVFANGIVVLVPRFGIESPIRLRDLGVPPPTATYDDDQYTLTTSMCPDGPDGPPSRPVTLRLFQQVTVCITDHKDETTGKRSARMTLVSAE